MLESTDRERKNYMRFSVIIWKVNVLYINNADFDIFRKMLEKADWDL